MINKNDNNKTRRKISMLQDSLSKMKFLVVLALLVISPILSMQAIAGHDQQFGIVDFTDIGADRIVAYWDTRDRDTFVQVTNTSSDTIGIHVQFFDVASNLGECFPCDFTDVLTKHDTHVYDVENIILNSDGTTRRCQGIIEGSYGSVIISFVDLSGEYEPNEKRPLIGMFRIIDELGGYEYRTNAAGKPVIFENGAFDIDSLINFSAANGNELSDMVGIAYIETSRTSVVAAGVTAVFGGDGEFVDEIMIYDEVEGPTSCLQETFSCNVGNMNKGIDLSLPNSFGDPLVCASSILSDNSSGWMNLPFLAFVCADPVTGIGEICTSEPYFVGFLGLNNGDGTGSMDSWWGAERHCYDEGGQLAPCDAI